MSVIHTIYPSLHLIERNLISCLVSRRLELGLSQETLALQLGMKKSNFQVWERGRDTPLFINVLKWARALDMNVRLIPMGEVGQYIREVPIPENKRAISR